MKDIRINSFKSILYFTILGTSFLMSCNNRDGNGNSNAQSNFTLVEKTILEQGDLRNDFKPLINVKYPLLVDTSDKEAEIKFNNEIKEYISSTINGFKQDIVENANSRDSSEIGVFLRLSYKVISKENDLISICFYLNSEWNGPHPIIDLETFNYDLKSKKFIQLSDIIKGKESNMELIEISNSIIEKMWESNECNINQDIKELRNFNLKKDSLILGFDIREVERNCEVITISVPFSKLKDILNEDGVIKRFK